MILDVPDSFERRKGAWSASELAVLLDVFPSAFPPELARLFPGRSRSSITQMARKYGLAAGERKVYFPETYTNIADGNYVSGLIDGEGSFGVSIVYRRGLWNFNPKFGIGLRIDDSDILLWLLTYFGCGNFNEVPRKKSPMAIVTIGGLYDIMRSVLPHFDAFPLRAKKQHDFAIWREMVLLQAKTFRCPWSPETRSKMLELYAALKAMRLLHGSARKQP